MHSLIAIASVWCVWALPTGHGQMLNQTWWLTPASFQVDSLVMNWPFCCVLQSSEIPHHIEGTSSTWNCSVQLWPSFRRHFRCNMRQECANREDEIECPYSYCSQGGLLIDHRCYFHPKRYIHLSWFDAQQQCRLLGANLASLTSLRQWNGVMTWLNLRPQALILGRRISLCAVAGLKSAPQRLPFV